MKLSIPGFPASGDPPGHPTLSKRQRFWIGALVTYVGIVVLGYLVPSDVIPNPTDILKSFPHLWTEFGLAGHMVRSVLLALSAIGCASAISLTLAYLSSEEQFRPFVHLVTKLRFTSLNGIFLIGIAVFTGGFSFKLFLLTYAITVFLTTSAYDVVAAIPRDQFDHARTLGMRKLRMIWEVVVLGTADKMWDAVIQNGAMAFMMLTVVEGLIRSGGGLGVLLRDAERFQRIEEIYALQLVIIILGMTVDYTLVVLKRALLPHAHLKLERG